MATTQVQARRGNSAQIAAFAPAAGEIVVNTTTNAAVVGDGSTLGGWAQLVAGNNLSDLTSIGNARSNLGLGTAATQNTGTSGATVPLLSGTNTWASAQTFSSTISVTGHTIFEGVTSTGATGTGKLVYDTAPTVSSLTVSSGGAAITGNSTVTGTFQATSSLTGKSNVYVQNAGPVVYLNQTPGGTFAATGYAAAIALDNGDGSVRFYLAGTGTAGNAISNTQAFSVNYISSKTQITGTWPTSSAGLPAGCLWNNAGVINTT